MFEMRGHPGTIDAIDVNDVISLTSFARFTSFLRDIPQFYTSSGFHPSGEEEDPLLPLPAAVVGSAFK